MKGRSLGIDDLDRGSGSEVYAGATSCAAPVWRGWVGAVAMMAGSAPVRVPPGYPTLSHCTRKKNSVIKKKRVNGGTHTRWGTFWESRWWETEAGSCERW